PGRGHRARPRHRRAAVLARPRHGVLDEPDPPRQRPDTQPYVGLRFVHDSDLPVQHPDRVAQADPVQRAEIGVEDEYMLHRFTSFVVVELERLRGVEPRWPAWRAGALPLCYNRIEPPEGLEPLASAVPR